VPRHRCVTCLDYTSVAAAVTAASSAAQLPLPRRRRASHGQPGLGNDDDRTGAQRVEAERGRGMFDRQRVR